jgi:microcystin-dependent protein
MGMRLRTIMGITLTLGVAGGYGLHAYAEGPPRLKPLFFAGTLEANGKLASGAHTIQLTMFDAETAGQQVCVSETVNAPVEAGRFRLEVSADCVAKLKAHSDLWVALKFAGPDGVPHEIPIRTKIGAAPYAMEAQHAVNASNATGSLAAQVVPAGAVMAFDLDACPAGWSAYAPARGRAVVGADTGLARGALVGNNTLSLTADQLPAHNHTGTTGPGNAAPYNIVHQHGAEARGTHVTGFSGGPVTGADNDAWPLAIHTHNFTTSTVGKGAAFDNRQASVALLYCRKN